MFESVQWSQSSLLDVVVRLEASIATLCKFVLDGENDEELKQPGFP